MSEAATDPDGARMTTAFKPSLNFARAVYVAPPNPAAPAEARTRPEPGPVAPPPPSSEARAQQLFKDSMDAFAHRAAALEAELRGVEAERDKLRMQADLVYGLLAENRQLRTLADATLDGNRLIRSVAAPPDAPRPRAAGRGRWVTAVGVGAGLIALAVLTALAFESLPGLTRHLHISIK